LGEGANSVEINLKNDEHMQTADSQLLEFKIRKILKILANFNELREEGVSRSQYVDELKSLFCKLYGYNTELMDLFMDIFGPAEVSETFSTRFMFSYQFS
jgi:ribosomal RNA methyltransferase Nop2